MWNSGKKNCALRDKKKILTLVLSEKKILNEDKNHNPPFKLNGRSLINHENKQFYSFEQIQEKLETNNFLKFYRLIARIPKASKDCLKENLF